MTSFYLTQMFYQGYNSQGSINKYWADDVKNIVNELAAYVTIL